MEDDFVNISIKSLILSIMIVLLIMSIYIDYSLPNNVVTQKPNGVLTTSGSSLIIQLPQGASALYRPFQNKLFFASSLWWLFYSNGTQLVYRTSANGSFWNNEIPIDIASDGSQFSVTLDGSKFAYADIQGKVLKFREGYPVQNGSILWMAPQQNASLSGVGIFPSISFDSYGHPWVVFSQYNPDDTVYFPMATFSQSVNGSWITPVGFPVRIFSNSGYIPEIASLKSGIMYFVGVPNISSGPLYGREWSNNSWDFQETISNHSEVAYSNIIGFKDIVYIAYTNQVDPNQGQLFVSSLNTTSNVWTTHIVPRTEAVYGLVSWMTLSVDDKGIVSIFWISESETVVLCSQIVDLNLTLPQTVALEPISIDSSGLMSNYDSPGNVTGLVYVVGNHSPYHLKFLTVGT